MRVTNYDRIASTFDRRYEEMDYRGVRNAVLRFVGSTKPLDVLEVGCGTGRWLAELRGRQRRCAGIDVSTGMLALARRALPDTWLARGRAEALPWAACAFDRVLCVNSFHHFGDKLRALAEARRVLRPGGQLMVLGLDPHVHPLEWWIYDYFPQTIAIDHERYLSSSQLRQAMESVGFVRCETTEAQRITDSIPVDTAIARGFLDRNFTSQMSVLTEEEYEEGLRRIGDTRRDTAARGQALMLESNIGIYATMASVE
jgi:ubiquinone/menaquinone biosynthesis C-methylase UbiE